MPRRILVVDDHPDLASITAQALELRDYEAAHATTRLEALELAGSFKPDIVLLEWDLGRTGLGLGLAAEIRARAGRLMCIVMLSLHDEPPGFRAREPFDLYLTKPVTIVDLVKAFEALQSHVN